MGSCMSKGRPHGPQKKGEKENSHVKPHKPSVTKTPKGKTLGESAAQSDPREAAAKAAEKRRLEKISQNTKSNLGAKLEEQRNKSANRHLLEQAEQQLKEKQTQDLVYD